MAEIPYSYDSKHQHEVSRIPVHHCSMETDYGYWKNRMSTHLMGIDMSLWEIVEDGFTLVTTTPTADKSKRIEDSKFLMLKPVAFSTVV